MAYKTEGHMISKQERVSLITLTFDIDCFHSYPHWPTQHSLGIINGYYGYNKGEISQRVLV